MIVSSIRFLSATFGRFNAGQARVADYAVSWETGVAAAPQRTVPPPQPCSYRRSRRRRSSSSSRGYRRRSYRRSSSRRGYRRAQMTIMIRL